MSETMTKIDVKLDATDSGSGIQVTIDKQHIKLDKGSGAHQIEFKLKDKTSSNKPVVFNTADPICYADGVTCPSQGQHDSDQLSVGSCTSDLLVVNDANSNVGEVQIGYALNFLYGSGGQKSYTLDPIIINGGVSR